VSRPVRRSLRIAAVLLVLATGAMCNPSRPPRPNVVLIVVDTLRADHLGSYGYDRPTSPRLDALAHEGARFTNARATSSWTLPSVATMLTARYPAAHGAERNTAALSEEVVTMPEAFRDAGYLTTAFSANPAFVTPLQGFAQGFDTFTVKHGAVGDRRGDTTPSDPWFRSAVEVSAADEITSSALEWVVGFDSAPAPYFLYVHYFDPHAGYFPPPDYATRFGVAADDPLRGEAQWPLLLSFTAPASAEDTKTLVNLYDAEIAFTDQQIGVLVDGIRARSERPTFFVIVADHGEEFADHGGIQHGRTLYDELLRVPFIVVGPGITPGSVVESPVSLVSLWPTLSQLAGPAPPLKADGPGLIDLLRGQVPGRSPNLFADLEPRFPRDGLVHRRAVVDGTWKLMVGADRSLSLYDMQSDPKEGLDVGATEMGREKLLQTILKAHDTVAAQARTALPPETIELTNERRDRLKALGYLQ
jgi:arylsulfatase A-like enzyme